MTKEKVLISLELVKVIVRDYFGNEVSIHIGEISYTASSGICRLQILKELYASRLAMCRIFISDQSIGYFYFDVVTHELSRVYKDD